MVDPLCKSRTRPCVFLAVPLMAALRPASLTSALHVAEMHSTIGYHSSQVADVRALGGSWVANIAGILYAFSCVDDIDDNIHTYTYTDYTCYDRPCLPFSCVLWF